jgi:hypothetical protein
VELPTLEDACLALTGARLLVVSLSLTWWRLRALEP